MEFRALDWLAAASEGIHLPYVAGVSSEVGQDGEHPAVAVVGLGQVELEQEVSDVALNGAFTDDQAPAG